MISASISTADCFVASLALFATVLGGCTTHANGQVPPENSPRTLVEVVEYCSMTERPVFAVEFLDDNEVVFHGSDLTHEKGESRISGDARRIARIVAEAERLVGDQGKSALATGDYDGTKYCLRMSTKKGKALVPVPVAVSWEGGIPFEKDLRSLAPLSSWLCPHRAQFLSGTGYCPIHSLSFNFKASPSCLTESIYLYPDGSINYYVRELPHSDVYRKSTSSEVAQWRSDALALPVSIVPTEPGERLPRNPKWIADSVAQYKIFGRNSQSVAILEAVITHTKISRPPALSVVKPDALPADCSESSGSVRLDAPNG